MNKLAVVALEFEVHPKLPRYELRVDVAAGEDFRGVEQLTVGPKGVSDKAQTIGADEALEASLLNDSYPVLQCDVNFDGYQGLLVFSMTGTPANERITPASLPAASKPGFFRAQSTSTHITDAAMEDCSSPHGGL